MAESGSSGARPSPAEELPENTRRAGKKPDYPLGRFVGAQKLSWNEIRVRAARFAEE